MEHIEITSENIEIISKDRVKMFIPSDHPFFKKGIFNLIGNGEVPLGHKLLKQLFFNYPIQNNSSELIEIINFLLPLDLGIEGKFIEDLFNLTDCDSIEKKLSIKLNKKQIIESMNDNWNFEDFKTGISEYVNLRFTNNTLKEIESKFPDISFLKSVNNFRCSLFKYLHPSHYFQEDVILHIMENLLYKSKYNKNEINPLTYISRFGSERLIKEIFDNFSHILSEFAPKSFIEYEKYDRKNNIIRPFRTHIEVSPFHYIAHFSKKEVLIYVLKKCGLETDLDTYINESKGMIFNKYNLNVYKNYACHYY